MGNNMKNIMNALLKNEMIINRSEDEIFSDFIEEVINSINRGFYLDWDDQINFPEGKEYTIDEIQEFIYGDEPRNWHIHLFRDGEKYLLFAKDLTVVPKIKEKDGTYYICERFANDLDHDYVISSMPLRQCDNYYYKVSTLFKGTWLECLRSAKILHIEWLWDRDHFKRTVDTNGIININHDKIMIK